LEKKSNGNGFDNSDNYYAMLINAEGKDVLVVITTQGDFEYAEEVNYEFFQKYEKFFPEIDIYWFTASRTKGKTTSFIEEKQNEEMKLLWICKGYVYPNTAPPTIAELYKYSDKHTADSLLEILNHLIREKENK